LFCQSLAEIRQEHGLSFLIAIQKPKLALMAPHSAITQGVDVIAELVLPGRILQYAMPFAGLQDNFITGRKLGWALSEAYLLDG
jgi:hypothetical protein